MSQSVEQLIGHLTSIKADIENEERRREELTLANQDASFELTKNNEALEDLKTQLDELRRAMPHGSDDEIMCLDVGGRIFKVYRSTLTLFKDSVLAVMVSTRWSEGMRQADGALFLDMDPEVFHEIITFLRSRRIDPLCKSTFSIGAADVASYLGIPVDHIKGMSKYEKQLDLIGSKKGRGLAFDVFLTHPARGTLTSLQFTVSLTVSQNVECTVYTKNGTHEGALAARESWTKIWTGMIQEGVNTVALGIQLRNGMSQAILIWCGDRSFLSYSDTNNAKNDPLQCTAGRGIGPHSELFQWPPRENDAYLANEHRYFAGVIKYLASEE